MGRPLSSAPPITATRPSDSRVAVRSMRSFGHRPRRGELAGRRVPDLSGGDRGEGRVCFVVGLAVAAHDQDAAIGQGYGRVPPASSGHRPRRGELAGRRVPDLGGGAGELFRVTTTDDEDATVGQERGRVERAGLGERARRAEGCRRRVPHLGRATTDDEDTTVSQERGCVSHASLAHRPRRGELAGRRVPDLSGGERVGRSTCFILGLAVAAHDQDPTIGQERGGVEPASLGERARRSERAVRGWLLLRPQACLLRPARALGP